VQLELAASQGSGGKYDDVVPNPLMYTSAEPTQLFGAFDVLLGVTTGRTTARCPSLLTSVFPGKSKNAA